MNKEQYLELVKEQLDKASGELNKEDYRDLCDEIASDCEIRIDALDNDDVEEEEE